MKKSEYIRVTLLLSKSMIADIDAIRERTGQTRTGLIRDALIPYIRATAINIVRKDNDNEN